jgi:hypothetical protein
MRHIQSFWVCCLLAANILLHTHTKKGVSTRFREESERKITGKYSANPFDLFQNQAKAVGKQQGATESAVVTKKNSGGHAQPTPASSTTSCFRHTPV